MKSLMLMTTPSCPSCHAMKPILLRLQQRHGFKLRVHELSRENRELFARLGIRTAPTLLLMDEDDDECISQFAGFYGEMTLIDRLRLWEVIPDAEPA